LCTVLYAPPGAVLKKHSAATLVTAGCNPSTLSIYFLILEVIVADNASTGESSMLCRILYFENICVHLLTIQNFSAI
jgi:hypothetical protein